MIPGPAGAALESLRRLVIRSVAEALPTDPGSLDDYSVPLGDRGLYGPGSMAWRIHADLGSMLIGGLSAVMLQTMHPLAMAGIAEHSRYREDPLGRLLKTARYVGGTTYGPTPLVDRLVAEVQGVHRHVNGVAADGRPYSAEEPALVTWVHITSVLSFVRAYQRYGPGPLAHRERDRYFTETAGLARRLGADDVPESMAEARAYLRAVRPELIATPEARDAVAFLRTPVHHAPAEVAAHRLVTDAAFGLLPDFARRAFGGTRVDPMRGAAHGVLLAGVLRWAIGPSILAGIAEQRVAGGPDQLISSR